MKQSQILLSELTDNKLQELSCDCLNDKKNYKVVYERFLAELNKRKNKLYDKNKKYELEVNT